MTDIGERLYWRRAFQWQAAYSSITTTMNNNKATTKTTSTWRFTTIIFFLLLHTIHSLDTYHPNITTYPIFPFFKGEPKQRVVQCHIAKTAGSSFHDEVNERKILQNKLVGNMEFCYTKVAYHYFPQTPRSQLFIVSFFRMPRIHVYSQYLECRYNDWGQWQTRNTNFPQKNVNQTDGFIQWIKHFYNHWNHRNDINMTMTTNAFNCYHPYNFQTRTMSDTCQDSHLLNTPKQPQIPTLSTAIANVMKVDFVAITEFYAASMCLFWYFLQQETIWKEVCQDSYHPHFHYTHGLPKHSEHDVSEDIWQMVDDLTKDDVVLYRQALKRFLVNVDYFETKTNISLSSKLTTNAIYLQDLIRDHRRQRR